MYLITNFQINMKKNIELQGIIPIFIFIVKIFSGSFSITNVSKDKVNKNIEDLNNAIN